MSKDRITLLPISTFGGLDVYVRSGAEVLTGKLPRYIVIDHRTNRILEEFRKRHAAENWARKNK